MKKILFLLLFIPMLSYSQITYDDVMSINSEDTFKRVMIENGYGKVISQSNDSLIVYGYNVTSESSSNSFCIYNNMSDIYVLGFNKTSFLSRFGLDEDGSDNSYDLIVKEIKSGCEYYKIITNDDDWVSYSCVDSKYIDLVGFTIVDGWGWIRNFRYSEE